MRKIHLLIVLTLIITLSGCNFGSRIVTCRDGNDIIFVDETWNDAGCYATIKNEEYEMYSTSNVIPAEAGEYEVVYELEHDSKRYTAKRIVKVVAIPEIITELNPGIDTIKLDTEHVDTGINITNLETDEYTIITSSNVDTSKVGTYTITYSIYHIDGYILNITRFVHVVR